MGNLAAVFDILTQHSDDVEHLVNQLGGVGNLVKAAPYIFRLAQVVSKHQDPERVVQVMQYNEQTKEKVEAFQKAHGLTVDGIVGDETWGVVEKMK